MIAHINTQNLTERNERQFITLEGGKVDLTPEVIRNSILGLEAAMQGLPDETKLALETMHTFIDGIYVRTVLMRAGSLVTGKIHRKEHIVIVSKGCASVVSEEFGSQQIGSPQIFVSPPGVKRLLFIHEDMIFTTVHPNPSNTRDIAKLESELMVPSFEEFDGGKK